MDKKGHYRGRHDENARRGSWKKAKMANDEIDKQATPPPGAPATGTETGAESAGGRGKAEPWAKGLRALYDSVVEEPLPDSFMDLLSKLDQDPE